MDQDAGVDSTRRPAHERAGDYRSARSFHIQPSEDQRREYHRRTHQHEQEDHRDRVVQQNRAKSARKGVAKSMGLISKKFKGLSKGNSSKGKAPPLLILNGTQGMGGTPHSKFLNPQLGGRATMGGGKLVPREKARKQKVFQKCPLQKAFRKSRLPKSQDCLHICQAWILPRMMSR